MSEKSAEKKLCDYVKSKRGRAYKFTSPGQAGVPDRIVVMPGGQIGFVELKSANGRLTENQKVQLSRLIDLGCRVYVLRDASDYLFHRNHIVEDIVNGAWPEERFTIPDPYEI